MTTTRPLWQWCLLGAVAMSLGWGLRGSIGGGSLGAMIPGAMIGLVLCLLLNRHSDAGLIAAFAAIGVGFGGQETYGQTVGLSLLPETFWWAILGFVIKGAVMGAPWRRLHRHRPRPSSLHHRAAPCRLRHHGARHVAWLAVSQ